MIYRLLADATVVVHLAFVAYVVVGGFLAWRGPRTIWLHLAAAGWGFSAVIIGIICPLTTLENWSRHKAGEEGLPSSGFIDHYLTGVIYPESMLAEVRVLVFLVVAASWIGFVHRRRRVTA